MILACEDSPKLCTGRKAIHLGLARPATPRQHPSPGALLLDPYSDIPLSRADARIVSEFGLVVVDCSWNRLSDRGRYPDSAPFLRRSRVRRRLPLLFAANPQHYGRLTQLNTAEALGASLYVLYGKETARTFLDRFSFGPSFAALNEVLVEEYHSAAGAEGIRQVELRRFSTKGPGSGTP